MSNIKSNLLSFFHAIGLMSKMTRSFEKYITQYASSGKTLDIGAGGSPYAKLFPNRVSVDIVSQEGVDVVADVHDLSVFKNEEFDIILCTEALEHFHDPTQAIRELTRVLKRDGILILSTRFIFPLHNIPHDYYRFTEYGLRYLLRGYDIKKFVADGNTMTTLAILYQRIGYQCDTLWFKPLKLLWFIKAHLARLFSWVLTKEHGDIGGQTEVKNIMTSGYLVVAKKK